MLTRLVIQNLATILLQEIEFGPGFTAITGETGAGKSVLLKALGMLMGDKCPQEAIRAGEEFLRLEGCFEIHPRSGLAQAMAELDLEPAAELVIQRKVSRGGKGRITLNGFQASVKDLESLAPHLLHIQSQHAQQSLIQSARHLEMLDDSLNLGAELEHYQRAYKLFRQKEKALAELCTSEQERLSRLDFLRFQLDEIEQAGFTPEEEAQLQEELILLSQGERLVELIQPVASWAEGEDEALRQLQAQVQQLAQAARIDQRLQPLAEELSSALISLEEGAREAASRLSRLDLDPQRLEEVNQRLALLDKLKRKYGSNVTEIQAQQQKMQEEWQRLDQSSHSQDLLRKDLACIGAGLVKQAQALSQKRQAAAPGFAQGLLAILADLGLEKARFQVEVQTLPQPCQAGELSPQGMDQVEFLISTNPGLPLQPLAKVASGGELSRIMLALKVLLNQEKENIGLVFDEVDAGISGQVAVHVGEKLKGLAQNRQVISITHSPQIAGLATHHLRVHKVFTGQASFTQITNLDHQERIQELARFLGGKKPGEKSLDLAKDMLEEA